MKRLRPSSILCFGLLFSSLAVGQQTDDGQVNPPADNVDLVTQIQQLRAEVERLSQQVDRLNNEVNSLQANGVAPAPPVARTSKSRTPAVTASKAATPAPEVAAPAQNEEAVPMTVLVFHDGKRVETPNYAIVGESVWVYSEQESRKYKLEDLDVDATKKVNSDHGVSFQLPPSR